MQVSQITVTRCVALIFLYVRLLLYAGTYPSYALCDTIVAVCKASTFCRYISQLHTV